MSTFYRMQGLFAERAKISHGSRWRAVVSWQLSFQYRNLQDTGNLKG
jgi:hypothetical protein